MFLLKISFMAFLIWLPEAILEFACSGDAWPAQSLCAD
jgi:hypothetical protein